MLEFGEYKPDIPPLLNDGLTRAEGVLPQEIGYVPINQLANVTTTAIAERPQGIFTARDPTAVGATYVFVGTQTKLYQADGAVWSDVSGAVYTTDPVERWDFAQWGDEVMATNFADPIQVKTLGAGAFGNLTGSPPQARYIAVVDNFVVLGNILDAGTYYPQRVQWSGINDNTAWATSSITQADFEDLFNNGGWIMGVVGGDYGIIFQEFQITRMTYIGSPLIFQFDTLEQGRGAYAPGGIIPIGNNIAYIAQDGFFVFDGSRSIPIGDGKIDRSFFADSGPIALDRDYVDRISSAIYPNELILCWSYPSVNADPVGISDTILFYNYGPNASTRWSVLRTNTTDAIPGITDINHYILGAPLSQGYTLDGLDAVSTNIDSLPVPPPNDISLDSPVWTGQQKVLGVINEDLYMAFFNAVDFYEAFFETGEHQLNPPNRTSITMIRPFINDPAGTGVIVVAIAGRDTEQVTASYSNTVTINSSGFANIRSNSRFHRAFVKVTNGFINAEGIDIIQSTKVGRR